MTKRFPVGGFRQFDSADRSKFNIGIMEQNIYVWMDLRSSDNRGGKSSRIVFIGKENECIEFVKSANWSTLKREFGKAYRAFWTMIKPAQMICTVSAGRKGINHVEKSYTVNIK